jgi:hypothetical protein
MLAGEHYWLSASPRLRGPVSRGNFRFHIAYLLQDKADPFVNQHPFVRQTKAAKLTNYTTTAKPRSDMIPTSCKMPSATDAFAGL